MGARPEICDFEHATVDEIATAVRGSDLVVFAAGAGPRSGAARKLTMDRDTEADAAVMAGARDWTAVRPGRLTSALYVNSGATLIDAALAAVFIAA